MRNSLCGLIFLVFAGCAPTSLDDLRWEADAQMRKLVQELRLIESKEDLQKAVPKLRKRFNQIAGLLIEVKNLSARDEIAPSLVGEQLFAELARLYEMPGGRESIEAAQMEAVQLLFDGLRTPAKSMAAQQQGQR